MRCITRCYSSAASIFLSNACEAIQFVAISSPMCIEYSVNDNSNRMCAPCSHILLLLAIKRRIKNWAKLKRRPIVKWHAFYWLFSLTVGCVHRLLSSITIAQFFFHSSATQHIDWTLAITFEFNSIIIIPFELFVYSKMHFKYTQKWPRILLSFECQSFVYHISQLRLLTLLIVITLFYCLPLLRFLNNIVTCHKPIALYKTGTADLSSQIFTLQLTVLCCVITTVSLHNYSTHRLQLFNFQILNVVSSYRHQIAPTYQHRWNLSQFAKQTRSNLTLTNTKESTQIIQLNSLWWSLRNHDITLGIRALSLSHHFGLIWRKWTIYRIGLNKIK